MKVSFEYTEKDYKKFLLKNRITNNIVLFVIGLGIYLYFTLNKISLIYLPLFILGLILVLFLLNLLYVFAQIKVNNMLNYNICGKYTVELLPGKYSITINRSKLDYKYSEIKYIKEHKNSFVIKLNKFRESLVFEKNKIKEEDYNKMIKMFKEKINK